MWLGGPAIHDPGGGPGWERRKCANPSRARIAERAASVLREAPTFCFSEDVHHPSFWMSQRDPSIQRTGSHRLEAVLKKQKTELGI